VVSVEMSSAAKPTGVVVVAMIALISV